MKMITHDFQARFDLISALRLTTSKLLNISVSYLIGFYEVQFDDCFAIDNAGLYNA